MKKEIVVLFLINICSGIGYSLIAPLFPSVALQKGINETIIGLIIASFAISNSLITPFTQIIFTKLGKKKAFSYALLAEVNIFF